jgi:hypothetical protein
MKAGFLFLSYASKFFEFSKIEFVSKPDERGTTQGRGIPESPSPEPSGSSTSDCQIEITLGNYYKTAHPDFDNRNARTVRIRSE